MIKLTGSYNNGKPTINGRRVSLAKWLMFSLLILGGFVVWALLTILLFYLFITGVRFAGAKLGYDGGSFLAFVLATWFLVWVLFRPRFPAEYKVFSKVVIFTGTMLGCFALIM